jgi:hypothetical protein
MGVMTEPDFIESTAIELRESSQPPSNLFRTDDPVEVVQRATRVADSLKGVLRAQGLISMISGREYVRVEGWSVCGAMLGVIPVVEWTRKLDNGWEARAVAQTLDGRIIGAAEAQCTKDERTWKSRDDYALRSMAQTRAVSKALRGPLGFIVTLAGFEATPAEEMTFAETPVSASKPSSDDQPYVGDDDHAPPYVNRGGQDTRPQRPELLEAAKGLALPAVQSCYEVAGLEIPVRKRDCFRGLDDVQSAALEAALKNRRFKDLYPSDLGYTPDDLAPALKGDVDDDADDLPWGKNAELAAHHGDPSLLVDEEPDPADIAEARKRLEAEGQ